MSHFSSLADGIGMRPEDYLKNRAQVAVRQQIVEALPQLAFPVAALFG